MTRARAAPEGPDLPQAARIRTGHKGDLVVPGELGIAVEGGNRMVVGRWYPAVGIPASS